MVRLFVLALAASIGCSFNPATLPLSGVDASIDIDAPIGIDAAAAIDASMAIDAPVDAVIVDGPMEFDGAVEPDGPLAVDAATPVIDAPPPDVPEPDAAPPDADVCSEPITPLSPGQNVEGQLAGASLYVPSCGAAATSGPENLYLFDVTDANSIDLVLDVVELDPALDTTIDVTSMCSSSPVSGICTNVGTPGAGEVVVIPFVTNGARYIAVDAARERQGRYRLRALLRGVVPADGSCSADLSESRCQTGLYCVERNGGQPSCGSLEAETDHGNNDTACKATPKFTKDSVFHGTFSNSSDVDVIEIAPATNGTLRVTVDDGAGGCSVDSRIELMSGLTCEVASVIQSDDNSGLGPCPFLAPTPVVAGQRYWLRMSPAPGAAVPNDVAYQLVIDFAP